MTKDVKINLAGPRRYVIPSTGPLRGGNITLLCSPHVGFTGATIISRRSSRTRATEWQAGHTSGKTIKNNARQSRSRIKTTCTPPIFVRRALVLLVAFFERLIFRQIFSRVFPWNDCRLSRVRVVILIQAAARELGEIGWRDRKIGRGTRSRCTIYDGFARRNRKRDRYNALHFPETLIKHWTTISSQQGILFLIRACLVFFIFQKNNIEEKKTGFFRFF